MNNYLILGGALRQLYQGRMLNQQGLPTVTSADLGRLNLSLEEAIKASSVLLSRTLYKGWQDHLFHGPERFLKDHGPFKTLNA